MEKDNNNDELLEFLEEEIENNNEDNSVKWKILIVDDEPEVHRATRIVLEDLIFEGKGIEYFSAFSAKEAMIILQEHNDIALCLLDIVMEEDDAGLKIVRYIRDELKNYLIRIILRTGQPGQAPEKKVIMEYDINDYKEKTELTVQKLLTTVIAALRGYRDIQTIENNKKGLERIIESSTNVFELQSMKKFSSAVLQQLINILNLQKNAIHISSCAVTRDGQKFTVLAATGDYDKKNTDKIEDVLPAKVLLEIQTAFKEKKSKFHDNYMLTYYKTKGNVENVIYMETFKKLNNFDKYLIDVYCTNVSVAFENIRLNEEIENTQKEIIYTIGEIIETRSPETGFHVKRVAEYSKLLALKYGLPERTASLIGMASPMHDIGKVGISDDILNKPGSLGEEEFNIVKKHSQIGYDILKHSERRTIKTAASIALHHHEKYDGTGYPRGLKGDEIDICGRIVAITDVFDALGNDRVYKKAWDLNQILDYFQEQKGKHFDPKLVDIFMENLDEFLAIKKMYKDKPKGI